VPEQRWPIGTTFDPIRTYDTGIGQIDPNLVRYLRGAADTQTATTPATQQMVPVDPSFRDRLEMLLSDTFGHTPVGRRRANMFMDALEWVPGVDEGLLFSDAGEAVEQGKYITGGVLGGLGALSMAPFVPPGAGRSLEEIMKSLKKKVKKRPDDTPVIPDSGEGKRYDSNLPVSDHAQGRRTREADIRRQQKLDLRPEKWARAKDQDWNVDTPLYHHTNAPEFPEFRLPDPDTGISAYGSSAKGIESSYGPGVYTSTSPTRYGGKPANTMRSMTLFSRGKIARPLKVQEAVNQVQAQIENGTRRGMLDVDPNLPGNWRHQYWSDIHQILKDQGFTGLQMNELVLVFDPKNMRRIDAKFDPAKAGSADLLSGIGSFAATQGIA
jgi:hypothetical protein